MLNNDLMKKIKENPVLTIVASFATIVSIALTVFITTSFATVDYVNKEVSRVEKESDKQVDKIEKMIKVMDNRVYEMWKKIPNKQTP